MAEPDDFRRFEFECPSCKRELSEWMEKCPQCGQSLFEVYSGTYRARRAPWTRWVAVVLLLEMLVGLVRLIFYVLQR